MNLPYPRARRGLRLVLGNGAAGGEGLDGHWRCEIVVPAAAAAAADDDDTGDIAGEDAALGISRGRESGGHQARQAGYCELQRIKRVGASGKKVAEGTRPIQAHSSYRFLSPPPPPLPLPDVATVQGQAQTGTDTTDLPGHCFVRGTDYLPVRTMVGLPPPWSEEYSSPLVPYTRSAAA